MATGFVGENPVVDLIPDAGATLADPEHSDQLHNPLRDLVVGIGTWIKDQMATVKADGWVTTRRIAAGAVTNEKVSTAGISASKIVGTFLNVVASSVRANNDVTAGNYLVAEGYLKTGFSPPIRFQEFAGTLGSNGIGSTVHGIEPSANLRMYAMDARYRGGEDERVAVKVTVIDGTSIHVEADGYVGAPSPAGKRFVVLAVITENPTPWT